MTSSTLVPGSTQQSRILRFRKALAWRALNGMKSVWKSNLSQSIKVSFFQATVESVLLYGFKSWGLKETLQKSLDGCFTGMLRAALNINWSEHVTSKQLYGGMLRSSDRVASRSMHACDLQVSLTDTRSFQLTGSGRHQVHVSPDRRVWGGELCGASQIYG